MPTPEFILALRKEVGHDLLHVPTVAVVACNDQVEQLAVKGSAVLTGTKRMLGCEAASQIAAAPVASFLPLLLCTRQAAAPRIRVRPVNEPEAIPADRLKRSHFGQSRAWSFVDPSDSAGNDDESCVLPVDLLRLGDAEFGQFLVAAVMKLSTGVELPGAVQLTRLGGRIEIVPAFVFMLDRQLEPISMETERLLSRFTKTPGVRVTRWRLEIVLPGESRMRAGSIRRSFVYLMASTLVRLGLRKLAAKRTAAKDLT